MHFVVWSVDNVRAQQRFGVYLSDNARLTGCEAIDQSSGGIVSGDISSRCLRAGKTFSVFSLSMCAQKPYVKETTIDLASRDSLLHLGRSDIFFSGRQSEFDNLIPEMSQQEVIMSNS